MGKMQQHVLTSATALIIVVPKRSSSRKAKSRMTEDNVTTFNCTTVSDKQFEVVNLQESEQTSLKIRFAFPSVLEQRFNHSSVYQSKDVVEVECCQI